MRRSWVLTAVATVTLAAASTAVAQTPIGPVRAAAPAAEAQTSEAVAVNDPWERANRSIYGFNMALDRAVIRPPIVFYHHAAPRPIRNAIHNAVTNATGPIIFINDVLQLRPKQAATTLARFVVNTTVGVAGFNDVAADGLNLPYHNADFGQTLGRYGVGTGPYLFIPILGPSTVRDIFGRAADGVIDPLNVVNYDGRASLGIARVVAGGVDARDRADAPLKDIQATATDPYAFIRSAYLQMRAAAVRGEDTAASVKGLPDFGPEPIAGRTNSTPSTPPAPATTP